MWFLSLMDFEGGDFSFPCWVISISSFFLQHRTQVWTVLWSNRITPILRFCVNHPLDYPYRSAIVSRCKEKYNVNWFLTNCFFSPGRFVLSHNLVFVVPDIWNKSFQKFIAMSEVECVTTLPVGTFDKSSTNIRIYAPFFYPGGCPRNLVLLPYLVLLLKPTGITFPCTKMVLKFYIVLCVVWYSEPFGQPFNIAAAPYDGLSKLLRDDFSFVQQQDVLPKIWSIADVIPLVPVD